MEKKPEKKGLGRGLSALMSDVNLGPATESSPRRADLRVAVEKLRPNPLQPRKDFDAEALQSLADSIRQKGIIQPLIVRPVAGAAREHPTVLVIGLALSIALMGLAATFIARLLNKHRWIAYVGLAIIVYVALKMMWEGWHEVAPHVLTMLG